MNKVRRMERIVALTKLLTDSPYHLFSLSYFSSIFGSAKSTLSEDITAIRQSLNTFGLGTLETVAGASGGVRFLPVWAAPAAENLLKDVAGKLAAPDRIIPGGFLYMSDILFDAHLMVSVGEVLASRFAHMSPDYVMTVETKGIPLALMTARALNLPLVTVRRGSKVTEGSSVSINYVSGSSKRIQTMWLPKRSIPAGAKILIVDDFMKAGGTAQGMVDLAGEVSATVVGTGVLVATAQPEEKLVADYTALLILHNVDEHTKQIDIKPAPLA